MFVDHDSIRNKIHEEINLARFTEDEQKEIMEKLEENISTRVYIDVLDRLTPTEQEAFYVLGEKKDSDEFREFLSTKVPQLNTMVEDAVKTITADLKSVLK